MINIVGNKNTVPMATRDGWVSYQT